MKIIPSGTPPDVAAAHDRTGAARAQQWRKALEDAQWQARQRVAASEAGQDAARHAPTEPRRGPARPAAQLAPDSMVAPVASPAIPAAAQRIAALADAIVVAAGSAPVPPRGTTAQAPAGVPAGLRESPAPAGRPAAAEPPPPPAPQRYELAEWPDVVVQASVQGRRISVGMRDRALQEGDALELFHCLRAQLRAAGLELTSLTVNGWNVAAADGAAPEMV